MRTWALWACVLWSFTCAAIQYRAPVGGPGSYNTLQALVNGYCNKSTFPDMLGGPVSSYFPKTAGDTSTYNAGVPGTQFVIDCNYSSAAGTQHHDVSVYIMDTCPVSGTAATLGVLTTITSLDTFGKATISVPITAPQCNAGCTVDHTGPSTVECVGYLDPTEVKAVGKQIYVSCSQGNTYTGAHCNSTGAETTGVPSFAAKPLGFVTELDYDNPTGAGTSGSGWTGKVGKPIDVSGRCLDSNGDGIDDVTGTTCAVKAANALKVITDGFVSQMDAVGDGALGSDVATLSNNNGGWFSGIEFLNGPSGLLNPTPSCTFVFHIPGYDSTAAIDYNASWCSLKTQVEPFLAFAMYCITAFVAFSQFRRVS